MGKVKNTFGRIKTWFKKLKLPLKILLIAGIVLVVLLLVLLIARPWRRGGAETTTTVSQATAETGSITTTVTGSGTLEAGTTDEVTIPEGVTVEEVLVEEGDAVEEGDVLATVDLASVASALLEVRSSLETVEDEIDDLDDDEVADTTTDEYLESLVLAGELEDLEEAEAALEALIDDPQIVATSAGTIGSVNVSDGGTASSGSGTSSVTTDTASATSDSDDDGSGSTFVTAFYVTGSAGTSTVADDGGTVSENELSTLSTDGSTTEDSTTTENTDGSVTVTTESGTELTLSGGTITALSLAVTTSTTEIASVENMYDAYLSWSDDGTTATITIVTASSSITFSDNIVPEVEGASVTSAVYDLEDDDGSTSADRVLIIQAAFDESDDDGSSSSSASTSGTGSGTSGTDTTGSSSSATGSASSGTTGSTTSSGTSSGSTSSSTSSGTTSTDSGSTSTASTGSTTAFTIVSDDDACLTLSIDEADILSIEEGQTATVSVDAIEDETFEGTVTSVTTTTSGSSGSVKYTAEVTVERTDEMLLGMSASATITVSEAEDAVLIPVSALQESGTTTFVYTEADDEGNLSGAVEVETGLSDGTNVEILSGLSEGDVVYYTRTDAESEEGAGGGLLGMFGGGGSMGGGQGGSGDSGDSGGQSDAGGDFSGGGEAPSGGDSSGGAPSGDMSSGQ